MSFHSWLQNLQSVLTPHRRQRLHRGRGSARARAYRPSLEVLEDRVTPSFVPFGGFETDPGVVWGGYSGDFTSDGIVDQLSTISATEVAVRPGLGDGTFGDPIISYAPYAGYLAAADFDGDGRLDVASVRHVEAIPRTDWVSVLLGEGDGTFLSWEHYELGGYGDNPSGPDGIGVFDAYGDGRWDVVVGGSIDGYGSAYFYQLLYNDGIWRQPQLWIGDVSVTEGNTGAALTVFNVTLAYGPDQPVTVQYATGYGTATAGSDYQAVSGTLTFAPGETTKTITVPVYGDSLREPNETFFVNLSSPTNAMLANEWGQGTIVDDELHSYLSISSASRSEGNIGQMPLTLTVTLSPAYDAVVTVNWATAGGGATAGSDYEAASGTLTFAPGETSKTITVLVNGDRLAEPNEGFLVNLSNPTNADISGWWWAAGTIVDDEPRITISDVSAREGRNNKTKLFSFTATLSAAYDEPVTMSYRTVDGTATTGDNDYVAKTGTLTFAPGETTKTITITVKGDSKKEASETFYLDLFDLSSNASFTKSRGIGTVLNDD